MVERSPNFPQVTLGEAIDSVKLIYQREGRAKMPKLSAIKPLGYTSVNGRSLGILAALRAYNLLEGRGDDVRVSDDALTILNAPRDSDERRAAILQSFEAPPAFALLRAKEGASTDTLRWHLIKAKFRDDAADKLIAVFVESRAYVNAEVGSQYMDQSPNDDAPATETSHGGDDWQHSNPIERDGQFKTRTTDTARERSGSLSRNASSIAVPDFVVKLGDDLVAVIEIKGGEPSPRHLAKLARFINLQRALLLDDDDDAETDASSD